MASNVSAGYPVKLDVAGETVELAPETILVSTEPLPGLAVASDKYITVGIDATLTPELKAEGLAREIVRRVQDMRKNAGFNIEDRITTCYQAQGALVEVFVTWGEYIASRDSHHPAAGRSSYRGCLCRGAHPRRAEARPGGETE